MKSAITQTNAYEITGKLYKTEQEAKEAEEKREKCPISLDDIIFDGASVTSCFHVFNKDAIAALRILPAAAPLPESACAPARC